MTDQIPNGVSPTSPGSKTPPAGGSALPALFASQAEADAEVAKGYASLTAEIERLRAMVYRPGVLRCAKCQFRLVRTVFYAQDGAMSAGGSDSEPCPNGCGPLWPVTWKEECQASDALWDQQLSRALRAEALLARLSTTLQRIISSGARLGGEIRCEAIAMLRSLEREDALALRPMADAPRDRPISARVTTKPGVLPDRWAHSAGLWFTIRHGGVLEGGYDMGWQYPGHGGIPDHWFEGWWPLPSDDIDPTPQSSPA